MQVIPILIPHKVNLGSVRIFKYKQVKKYLKGAYVAKIISSNVNLK